MLAAAISVTAGTDSVIQVQQEGIGQIRQEEKEMAFVVGKIPESEKAKFSFINTKLTSEWAIDEDRRAFIVLTEKHGGPYEGTPITKRYVLWLQGERINIVASPLPATYLEHGAVMNWRVHGLSVPPSLQDKSEDVFQLIRDAFAAVGEVFDGDRYLSVNVEFDLPQHQ